MRSSSQAIVAMALTPMLAIALVACASSSSGNASNRTLVVDQTFEFDSLDPAREGQTTPLVVDHLLYDTLLTYNSSNLQKPIPSLATSWQGSSDNKTFTFKLRSGVKFSDGTPLTAADVAFSMNRANNVQGNANFLVGAVTATAPDPATVVLQSATPDPSIPAKTATAELSILNSALVKKNGGSDAADASTSDKAEPFLNQSSAGSGPYVLVSNDRTSQIILQANAQYWGPKPAYARIVIRNAIAASQATDVERNQAQIALSLNMTQASSLTGDVRVTSGPSFDFVFLGLNQDPAESKVTSNPAIDEAVRYGIDYNALLQIAGQGSTRATGIQPAKMLGDLPANDPSIPTYDVNRAKAAVARSGLTNPTFTLEYFSDETPYGVNYAAIASRIQADLKNVGVSVVLSGEPSSVAQAKCKTNKCDARMSDSLSIFPSPELSGLVFAPGGFSSKHLGWPTAADPQTNSLIAQAYAATDQGQRGMLWQQVSQRLNQVGPWVPLIDFTEVVAYNKSAGNVKVNPLYYLDWGDIT